MKRLFDAVLFDWDGVLADSESIKAEFWEELSKQNGHFGGGAWYARNCGIPGLKLAQMFIDEYKVPLQVEAIHQANLMMHETKMRYSTSIENTVAFCNRIPLEYHVGIGSSAPKQILHDGVVRFGIDERVQAIVSGCELRCDKPAPDIWLKLAKDLNVSPDRCLVIEDTATGVKSAKNAGMVCVAYTPQINFIPGCDFTVDNFTALTMPELERRLQYDKLVYPDQS